MRFGVIGQRISYSKSPDIFKAIFEVTGIDGRFEIFSFEPEELGERMRAFRELGMRGLSVTLPYKAAVIPYLDETDPVAARLNAVNSISFDSGRLIGHNTDWSGFGFALHGHGDRLRGGRALVFGNGGAASAAVYCLVHDFHIGTVTVVGRDMNNLSAFKSLLESSLPADSVVIETANISTFEPTSSYDITVNSTPLGGWNHPGESPLPENFDWASTQIYYDINYNADNLLVKQARDAGVIAIDGSRMLVAQAIHSFELWTGRTVGFEPIYTAVF